ncbi:hypothetical protein KI387_007029, partial [Taxus chinensis]
MIGHASAKHYATVLNMKLSENLECGDPEQETFRPLTAFLPENSLSCIMDCGRLKSLNILLLFVPLLRRYYSMYGHVEKLAEEIKKGADFVEGVEATLWQVPETLSEEVLMKMNVPPRSEVPIIEPKQLADADALIFGFPTRYGMMAAQFKAFLDATGGLWRSQQLAGKPAGIFYSTGSQGGGQETTPLTAITQLVHHGLIYVPIGYTFGAGMFEMDQ